MAKHWKIRCKHCGIIALPSARTKHLREAHPQEKGSYKEHFVFERLEVGEWQRVKGH